MRPVSSNGAATTASVRGRDGTERGEEREGRRARFYDAAVAQRRHGTGRTGEGGSSFEVAGWRDDA